MRRDRAPVQAPCDRRWCATHPAGYRGHVPGSVSWEEHVEASREFVRRHGRGEGVEDAAERMAARAGFGYGELVDYLGREPATWRPEGAHAEDALFYFGRADAPGHFLYYAELNGRVRDAEQAFGGAVGPWSLRQLDGGLAAKPGAVQRGHVREEDQAERVACLHHGVAKDGSAWTALSFWDRTGDPRFGSSSTVLCRGTWPCEEVLRRFRERLPTIWARVTNAGPIVSHRANKDPSP